MLNYLIMTPLETFEIPVSANKIMLGEWCVNYDENNLTKNPLIANYHWDDRQQLYEDYIYILDLYENLLVSLTKYLNEIHNKNESEDYWRIIIGPWLLIFLAVVYDRWKVLENVLNDYSVTDVFVLEDKNCDIEIFTMEHFIHSIKNDYWNLGVFSDILRFRKDDNIKFHNINNIKNDLIYSIDNKKSIKKIISTVFSFISNLQCHPQYHFIHTYLSKFENIFLQIKLKQFPYSKINIQNILYNKDIKLRELLFKNKNLSLKGFEDYLKVIIPMMIPTNYIEGYSLIINSYKRIYKKKYVPKVIFTSNAYFMDDYFKIWCAESVKYGSKLYIGQHGGHYGIGKFDLLENHEQKICDKYLSWGWGEDEKKIIPVGIFKKKKINKWRKKNKLLLILSGTGKYATNIISMPIAGQWLNYFEDQKQFYNNLSDDIKTLSKVRLYPNDNDWFQKKRWLKSFPQTDFTPDDESFEKSLSYSKVVVSGWNTTTYLESINKDLPTVIFWNSKYFELREDVFDMFIKLKEVGIFHDTPFSAAAHINENWKTINKWWNQKNVEKVKDEFSFKFARENNLTLKLSKIFMN